MENLEKTTIQFFAKEIASQKLEDLNVNDGLIMSKEFYLNRETACAEEMLSKQMEQYHHRIQRAKELVFTELKKLSKEEKDIYEQELLRAILEIVNVEAMEVLQLGSWQKALKLSDKTVVWIYKLGYFYFNEKKYEEALSLFYFANSQTKCNKRE